MISNNRKNYQHFGGWKIYITEGYLRTQIFHFMIDLWDAFHSIFGFMI